MAVPAGASFDAGDTIEVLVRTLPSVG